MGDSVWTQLFALAADFVSSLLGGSSSPQSQSSGGASPSVPANGASGTSTSPSATGLALILTRTEMTEEGIFGMIRADDGGGFSCLSLENRALSIPAGTYRLGVYDSPHAGHPVPILLDVPGRSEIEIHCGNFPTDSKGCILLGLVRKGDTIEASQAAFNILFPKIQAALAQGPVMLSITEIE